MGAIGLREYWIVNPMQKTVMTYIFEGLEDAALWLFDDDVPAGIYEGFSIKVRELL